MWKFESSESDLNSRAKVEKAMQTLLTRDDLGFLQSQYIKDAIVEIESNKSFLQNKSKLVVIGLGGSSLGTKAICQALFQKIWSDKIVFLDNVDIKTVDDFLDSIQDPAEYGWVLCSKSGGTIEVTSLFEYCHSHIEERLGFSVVENTIAVTEKKPSPLYNFAEQNSLSILSVPFDVGGRFSVFTCIGLLPLFFLGADLQKFYQGYSQSLANTDSIIDLSLPLWNAIEGQQASFYCFFYCDRLSWWGDWLQQLWSESLSKKQTRTSAQAAVLPTFVPARGASAQHSVLQQVIEGNEKKTVGFVRLKTSEEGGKTITKSLFEGSLMQGKTLTELFKTQAEATQKAVEESGHSTIVLVADQLNEESLASLMALWMGVIGVLGELMDIDAFNQPGVESGKVIARRVLSQ